MGDVRWEIEPESSAQNMAICTGDLSYRYYGTYVEHALHQFLENGPIK